MRLISLSFMNQDEIILGLPHWLKTNASKNENDNKSFQIIIRQNLGPGTRSINKSKNAESFN